MAHSASNKFISLIRTAIFRQHKPFNILLDFLWRRECTILRSFLLHYSTKRKRTWNEKWINEHKFIFFHAALSMHNRLFSRRDSGCHCHIRRHVYAWDVNHATPSIPCTNTWRKGPTIGPFYEKKFRFFSRYKHSLIRKQKIYWL